MSVQRSTASASTGDVVVPVAVSDVKSPSAAQSDARIPDSICDLTSACDLSKFDICALFSKVLENLPEYSLLAASALSVALAAVCFFSGMIVVPILLLAMALICLNGARLVSQLPTFESLKVTVAELQDIKLSLEIRVQELSTALDRIGTQIQAFSGNNDRFDGGLSTLDGMLRRLQEGHELRVQEIVAQQQKMKEFFDGQGEFLRKAYQDWQRIVTEKAQLEANVQSSSTQLAQVTSALGTATTKLEQTQERLRVLEGEVSRRLTQLGTTVQNSVDAACVQLSAAAAATPTAAALNQQVQHRRQASRTWPSSSFHASSAPPPVAAPTAPPSNLTAGRGRCGPGQPDPLGAYQEIIVSG